jgi:molybdate transport system ATP-binding protein
VVILDLVTRGATAKLSVAAGETVALVGPNGAGKTSLLLGALGLQPALGRITVGDRVLLESKAKVDVPVEDRRLGYVPQRLALFPHLSVLGNVAFGVRAAPGERRERARAVLASLRVSDLADRRPNTLSGGEAQRVALARALASGAEALLLDEPLAALDAVTRREVRAALAEQLGRLGLPALVVTHDAADVVALARRVIVLEAGQVVQEGTLEELRAAPATPFVASFTAA